MYADLEEVAAEFQAAQARLHRLAESVDDATWVVPPPRGGWSMGECVAHLTITSNRFIPILAEAAESAPFFDDSDAPIKPMRRDLAGWLLSWMMEPPVRLRMATSSAFVPGGAEPRAATVAAFDASQASMLQQIRALEGLDLTRIRVTSPFSASIRYTMWSALHILVAHQRRHLWQAERVRDRLVKRRSP